MIIPGRGQYKETGVGRLQLEGDLLEQSLKKYQTNNSSCRSPSSNMYNERVPVPLERCSSNFSTSSIEAATFGLGGGSSSYSYHTRRRDSQQELHFGRSCWKKTGLG